MLPTSKLRHGLARIRAALPAVALLALLAPSAFSGTVTLQNAAATFSQSSQARSRYPRQSMACSLPATAGGSTVGRALRRRSRFFRRSRIKDSWAERCLPSTCTKTTTTIPSAISGSRSRKTDAPFGEPTGWTLAALGQFSTRSPRSRRMDQPWRSRRTLRFWRAVPFRVAPSIQLLRGRISPRSPASGWRRSLMRVCLAGDQGRNGNGNFVLTEITVSDEVSNGSSVPEPGTLGTLAIALGGFAVVMRKRLAR